MQYQIYDRFRQGSLFRDIFRRDYLVESGRILRICKYNLILHLFKLIINYKTSNTSNNFKCAHYWISNQTCSNNKHNVIQKIIYIYVCLHIFHLFLYSVHAVASLENTTRAHFTIQLKPSNFAHQYFHL